MHWQMQPILWPIIIATLALLAVPHNAHPQQPSAAIRAACDGDVKKLCPHAYRSGSATLICRCMARQNTFSISWGCRTAWIKEHGLTRGECK
jgi:hypothetical protein